MKNRLIRLYYKIKVLLKFVKKELHHPFPVKTRKRFLCNTKGFLSESSVIYGLNKSNYRDYLSDYVRMSKCPYINIDYSNILDNKIIFEHFFNTKCNIIKSDFYLINKKIISGTNKFNINNINDIVQILDEKHELIFKPVSGGGGYNILKIYSQGQSYVINDKLVNRDLLIKKIEKLNHYMVYEKFKQTGFSNQIFPPSLNTIRILTLYHPYKKRSFIPIAIHRFGTNKSGFVDNWSNGGLSAKIDLNSGKMDKAVSFPYNGKLNWYDRHPDTGVQISGIVIPLWEKIKTKIIKLADDIPYLPYIGWDIVLSDKEFFLLEANSNTDVNLLQVHRPLLSNAEILEFYKYHNII